MLNPCAWSDRGVWVCCWVLQQCGWVNGQATLSDAARLSDGLVHVALVCFSVLLAYTTLKVVNLQLMERFDSEDQPDPARQQPDCAGRVAQLWHSFAAMCNVYCMHVRNVLYSMSKTPRLKALTWQWCMPHQQKRRLF